MYLHIVIDFEVLGLNILTDVRGTAAFHASTNLPVPVDQSNTKGIILFVIATHSPIYF